MSSLTFERSCAIPAANALPRVAEWFKKNGYEVVAKSTTELSLFYKAGSMIAARLDEHRHRLSVRSDGRRVTFDYSAGVSDGGLHVDAEKKELERRTDAAMSTLIGMPVVSGGGTSKRCPACSTMSEPGSAECAVCGSTLA